MFCNLIYFFKLKLSMLVTCAFVLFSLNGLGVSGFNERLRNDFFHIYRRTAVETRNIQNKPVTADKVTFSLFTKVNTTQFIRLDPDRLDPLKNTTGKIVFMVHGWTDSRESDWYDDMKNAFLLRDDIACVIQVDWNDPANQLYYISSINTYDVAKHITKVVVDLYKKHNVSLENLLFVGHSLGGQICGFVGELVEKELQKKLPRIVALDPAGPLFSTRPVDKRLNKDNAKVVQVVHTNGGVFGFNDKVGTADFFVNGGTSQPGCRVIDLADLVGSIDEPLMCDHRRAWAYYTEALLNPTEFLSKKCSNWSSFKINYCDDVQVALGDLENTVEGSFYLETNKDKPYAKKNKGVGVNLLKLLQN